MKNMQLKDTTQEKLKDLANRAISDKATFLVDLEVKGSTGNPIVWVYVESDKGGVKLDECVEISRKLQVMIEAHEVLSPTFTLNVSSPGLSQPLKVNRQYKVNEGRNAKVKYVDGDSTKTVTGVIKKAGDSGIDVEVGTKEFAIEFDRIIETKIQPVF